MKMKERGGHNLKIVADQQKNFEKIVRSLSGWGASEHNKLTQSNGNREPVLDKTKIDQHSKFHQFSTLQPLLLIFKD
jgi:hypothetical protein